MRRLLSTVLLIPGVTLAAVVAVAPSPASAGTRTASTRAEHVAAAVRDEYVFALLHPADYVAAYWRGHPGAHVQLALSTDGVHFSEPLRAGRDDLGRERHNGVTYGLLRSAHGAVAVRVITDRPIAHLSVLSTRDGAAVAPSGASTGSSPTTPARRTGTAATTTTAQPPVVSRQAWAADPAYMTWAPQFYPTKKLTVHHTDTANDYADQAGAEAQIRSIYYYHSVTQGWGDIGYNFLIDKFGTIYEGRYSRDYAGAIPSGDDAAGSGVTGAHTSGWNSGTVGIAMLGTFTSQDVTPAARHALVDLLAWEAARNGIDPQATQLFVNPVSGATITTPNIAAHRDYATTLCPGEAFYATLPAVRSAVASQLAGTPAQPPADTTPPSVPAALKATGGRNRVSLSWSASSDDRGVSGYEIWRSRSASTAFSQVSTTSSTSYVDGSLARHATYYYKVRAYDGTGNRGGFSPIASAGTT